jgi:hypothetical protein
MISIPFASFNCTKPPKTDGGSQEAVTCSSTSERYKEAWLLPPGLGHGACATGATCRGAYV